jgi:rhamnose utilization protein RhaD (predicted bifunctional aldolase and dehydrogenase)
VVSIREEVSEFCLAIGGDPLLVQGAGGNVSWKEGRSLWIKASGTWLVDACNTDIFVEVDQSSLRCELNKGNFEAKPIVLSGAPLRPSIETHLHSLLPHRIVVHLHAIEVLSYLVRESCDAELMLLFKGNDEWAIVEYCKPGKSLAEAVAKAISGRPAINIVFLKNHGVVIGGDSIEGVWDSLAKLTQVMSNDVYDLEYCDDIEKTLYLGKGLVYCAVPDPFIHQLARDENYSSTLMHSWALYPDHVVFLGAKPVLVSSESELRELCSNSKDAPELVFFIGTGVFALGKLSKAKLSQLRCFYDVLSRQSDFSALSVLCEKEVSDLLNWEAEKFRQQV